eukprot:1183128-Rhodomonas_salina.1
MDTRHREGRCGCCADHEGDGDDDGESADEHLRHFEAEDACQNLQRAVENGRKGKSGPDRMERKGNRRRETGGETGGEGRRKTTGEGRRKGEWESGKERGQEGDTEK